MDHDAVFCKHVRAIREVHDSSETFGLALCDVVIAAHVETGELQIGARIDAGLNFDFDRF